MKKIVSLTAVWAIALTGLVSCNKQTDIKTVDSQTNGGGSSGGSSGFNWTGTAPMSAKVNGVAWTPYGAILNSGNGYYIVQGQATDGSALTIMFSINATPGQVFSAPTPASVMWLDPLASLVLQANPGKVKVVTNNATTVEGYFWADTKDVTGAKDTVVHIAEGYFKVDKP